MSRAFASNSSALAKVKVRCAGMIWERILNVPGFSSIALATSARKLSTSIDGQRKNVEIASAMHLAPSAQEFACFAKSRLRQCHDDIPIGSHICRFHVSTLPTTLQPLEHSLGSTPPASAAAARARRSVTSASLI